MESEAGVLVGRDRGGRGGEQRTESKQETQRRAVLSGHSTPFGQFCGVGSPSVLDWTNGSRESGWTTISAADSSRGQRLAQPSYGNLFRAPAGSGLIPKYGTAQPTIFWNAGPATEPP